MPERCFPGSWEPRARAGSRRRRCLGQPRAVCLSLCWPRSPSRASPAAPSSAVRTASSLQSRPQTEQAFGPVATRPGRLSALFWERDALGSASPHFIKGISSQRTLPCRRPLQRLAAPAKRRAPAGFTPFSSSSLGDPVSPPGKDISAPARQTLQTGRPLSKSPLPSCLPSFY